MLDETISISVMDQDVELTKLQRHLLYCSVDDKAPSTRLYSDQEIAQGWDDLFNKGLVDQPMEATAFGMAVARACKDRPRS